MPFERAFSFVRFLGIFCLWILPVEVIALNLVNRAAPAKKTEVQGKVDLGDVRNGFIIEWNAPSVFQMIAPLVEKGASDREIMQVASSQKKVLNDAQQALLTTLKVDVRLKNLLSLRGARVTQYFRGINAIAFNFIYTSATEGEIQHLLNALTAYSASNTGLIKKIHPNVTVHSTLLDSPGLVQAPQNYRNFSITNGQRSNRDGFGIRIGIVDTGVNDEHVDLGGQACGNCKVIRGYDYVNQDNDPRDDNGHGTHVAAIAAGIGQISQNSNLVNLIGVAPGALIVPFKALGADGGGTSDHIISAIEDCADPNGDLSPSDRLDVCNLSLGGPGNPDDAMSVAVDQTTGVGVLFVVSAGNGGNQGIQSPGTARRALTVAASCRPNQVGVDPACADGIANFSSVGPINWIAENPATGNQEYLTLQKPDIAAPGHRICAAQLEFWQMPSQCNDANHIAISGTSMAAPHVTGLVAVIKQGSPSLTPIALKNALMNSAQNLGISINRQGRGLVQLSSALNLLQVPRDRMEVTSGPIIVFDVPDRRIQAYSRTVTFKNTNSSPVSISLIAGGLPSGMSVQGTNINNLGSNQQGNITLKFTLDHALLSAHRLYLNQLRFNIQPAGASAYSVSVGTYINVGEYIRVLLGDDLEFPIFSPTATATESQLKSISIQNLLSDYSLNISAIFDPAGYDDQRTFYSSRGSGAPNISFQVIDGGNPVSSILLAPNQTKIVNLQANLGADVPSYAYSSRVRFQSSPNGTLHSRVLRVYRGYALRLQSGWPMDALYVIGNTRIDHAVGVPSGGNRGQWKGVASGYTNPASYTFVSQDPHSVDVYGAWLAPLTSPVHASWIIRDKNTQGQPLTFHYPAPLNSFDLTFQTNTPLFTVTFDPKDLNGVSQADYLGYGFHGRDYRTGVLGRLPPLKNRIQVNQLPNYFRLTGSKSMIYDLANAGVSTANQKTLVWSYKLLGISSNVTLTNSPSQLIQRKVRGPLGQNFEISIFDREVADNSSIRWLPLQYLRNESSIFFYTNETNPSDFFSDRYGRTALIGFYELYNGFDLPSYFFTPTRMYSVKNWELNTSDTRGNRFTSLNEATFYRRNHNDHSNVNSIVLGRSLFSNPNSVLGSRRLGVESSSLTNLSADALSGIEAHLGIAARARFGSANRNPAVTLSTDITVNGTPVLQGCVVTAFNCLANVNFNFAANQVVNLRTTSTTSVPWRPTPLVNTLTQNFVMTSDSFFNSPPKFETIKLINTASNEENDTLALAGGNALEFVVDPQANHMQYANFFTTRYTESQNPGPFSSDPQRRGLLNSSYPILPCSSFSVGGSILSTDENIRVGCVRFRTNSDGSPDTLTAVTVRARSVNSNDWQDLSVSLLNSGTAFSHFRASLPNLCTTNVPAVQIQLVAIDSRQSSTTSTVTAFCP